MDLSILPPLPLLHGPAIATRQERETERLSSLCITAQRVNAELPSSAFNPSPGPGTHSTGCRPGKRCSCNGPCGNGNGGASGDDSSSRERGSTWRERTGSGAGSTDALRRSQLARSLAFIPEENPSPPWEIQGLWGLVFCLLLLANAAECFLGPRHLLFYKFSLHLPHRPTTGVLG